MSAQRQKDRERERCCLVEIGFSLPFFFPTQMACGKADAVSLDYRRRPSAPPFTQPGREGGGNIRYSANIRDRWLSLVTMWVGQQRLFDGNKELANRPTG